MVSLEKCWQVRQRASKHGDVPASKIWLAKISVLTYFNKFFDSFFHILFSVLEKKNEKKKKVNAPLL